MPSRQQLAPPYRAKDLMTVSSFISFCKKHSVRTDREELEFFDKQSLLLPACRVLYGSVEMSRIYAVFDGQKAPEWRYTPKGEEAVFNPIEVDPKPHYMHGGISHGSDNWLNFYEERDMIIIPGKIEYVPWKTYADKEPTFTTNPEAYNDFAETFYTPYQMYQLHWLQSRLTLKIKNESLINKDADWDKKKLKIQPFFTDLEPLRLEIVRLNTLDATVMDIYSINDQLAAALSKRFIENRREHGWPDDKDAEEEAIRDYEEAYPILLPGYANKIKALLETHHLTDESLYDTLRWYLMLCSFNRIELDFKTRIAYLSSINEDILRKNEDPCERASLLLWALAAIDSKRGTTDLKNEIISGMGKHCRFCHRAILKNRKNQSTCGRKECVRELSKVLKQEGRKSRRYNMR
jgi:hypothetical protein